MELNAGPTLTLYKKIIKMHVVFLLSMLVWGNPTFASASCALHLDGLSFDLAPLRPRLAFVYQRIPWAFYLNLCAPSNDFGFLPSCASKPSLSYQVEPDNTCNSLGVTQGNATFTPLPSGVPTFTLELIDSPDFCQGIPRRALVTALCAANTRSRILNVAEDCGKCCYTFTVASQAACPLSCARDSRTGLVCGGERRGKCVMSKDFVGSRAACVCAAGATGEACAEGRPNDVESRDVAAFKSGRAPSVTAPEDASRPGQCTPPPLLSLSWLSGALCCLAMASCTFRVARFSSACRNSSLRIPVLAYVAAVFAWFFGGGMESATARDHESSPSPRRPYTSFAHQAAAKQPYQLFYNARDLSRKEAAAAANADALALRPGAPPECTEWLGAAALRHNFTAQYGQDAAIYYTFFAGWLASGRKGTYVDLGASRPREISNSWFFDACLGWKGLCIEADPGLAAELRQSSRTCTVVNMCAAAAIGTTSYITQGFSGRVSEQGGTKVDCAPLDEILRMHGVLEVDYLAVDIEGNEVAALAGTDWDAVPVDLVLIETMWSNEMLDMLMHDGGFWRVADIGYVPHFFLFLFSLQICLSPFFAHLPLQLRRRLVHPRAPHCEVQAHGHATSGIELGLRKQYQQAV